jgi:molybdate transport system ATP-binding protein
MLQVQVRLHAGGFLLEASFNAPAPGITVLYGPSGAGKTTLMNLIAGLLQPEAGHIALAGSTLYDSATGTNLPPEARGLGCVFQDLRLFPHLDVRGNLEYGQRRARGRTPRITRARALELLDLGPLLSRRTGGLSGGERQRVALGRALLAHPRLLLLDEPLASLDTARRAELLPYFERLREERALPVLMVTHRYEEVLRLANEVVLLRAGRVLAQGSPAALSLRSELRQLVGPEALGAVFDSHVSVVDAALGLAEVPVGSAGSLRVPATGLREGQPLRVQLQARDLILAIAEPRGLSVRNCLPGVVSALRKDDSWNCLVEIDAGGVPLLARVTLEAAGDLALVPGLPIWVLVKAVSLRGHLYA